MAPRSAGELATRLRLEREPTRLREALTHGSIKETGVDAAKNEKLALLGDAVLELAIRHRAMRRENEMTLGELSILADKDSKNATLTELAHEADLGEYVHAGRSDGAKADSVFASALEAVLAAIFLDEGYPEAARVASLFLDREVPPLDPRDGGSST